MSNTEYTLQDVVGELSNIDSTLGMQDKSFHNFGNELLTALNNIDDTLIHIANALQQIADK